MPRWATAPPVRTSRRQPRREPHLVGKKSNVGVSKVEMLFFFDFLFFVLFQVDTRVALPLAAGRQ